MLTALYKFLLCVHLAPRISQESPPKHLLCNMSDPLSLVAAGAGFVGLAGQLAQGVIKLKEICSAIKDAPKDVAKLCESVELLQSLLEEVGQQVQQLSHGNVDDRLMREVLAHCETSRFKIGVSVKSICNSIRKSRLGAVRYVFKKKEIEDMLSDVERCKSNIIIARQSVEKYVGILLSRRKRATDEAR